LPCARRRPNSLGFSELDRLVRQRLDGEHVDELKAALRELLSLGDDS
jgi:hypothetical protein